MLRARTAPSAALDPSILGAAEFEPASLVESLRDWMTEEAPWWGCSFTVHLVALASLLLVGNHIASRDAVDGIRIDPAVAEQIEKQSPFDNMSPIEPNAPQDDVTESPLRLNDEPPARDPQVIETDPDAKVKMSSLDRPRRPLGREDGSPNVPLGLGGLASQPGDGPGKGRWGIGGPDYGNPGAGGLGDPGKYVGPYRRHGPGPHPDSSPILYNRCIPAALRWLARHQLSDGSWSLQRYTARCADGTCSGPGSAAADSGAVGLATLPFLAAGQTHKSRGIYQLTVARAMQWLLAHQKPDGDLRCGATMYAHGLATIALCEDYGMTGDRQVGYAAQRAVDFIQAAQHAEGGWRYAPREAGDLSVFGWQLMALKSAEIAGLRVDPAAFQRSKAFLQATSSARGDRSGGGLYAYTPGHAPTTPMTSVGLLCAQYLGMPREDPAMVEGTAHLLAHLPEPNRPNFYYWYYASQVMHNQPGTDWDTWNRKMRRLLIDTQERSGCAAGSWSPTHPAPDAWGAQGGRLMTTCLATLTAEVYYRYLPLYQLDGKVTKK